MNTSLLECTHTHTHTLQCCSAKVRFQNLGEGLRRAVGGASLPMGAGLTRLSSLDLEEGVLLEEAMEAGLMGGSFLSSRFLSNPFSRGEWAGLPLGEAGS